MRPSRTGRVDGWVVAALAGIVLSGSAACSGDSRPAAEPSSASLPATVEPGPTPAATLAASGDSANSAAESVSPSVPVRSGASLRPVPLNQPADAGDGVVVSVVRTTPVRTQGVGPGETAGEPAVAVTIKVQNGSGGPLDLSSSTVSLTTRPDGAPGRFSEGPPARPLTGRVSADAAVEGIYVFILLPGERGNILLDVGLAPGRPVLQLVGSLA